MATQFENGATVYLAIVNHSQDPKYFSVVVRAGIVTSRHGDQYTVTTSDMIHTIGGDCLFQTREMACEYLRSYLHDFANKWTKAVEQQLRGLS